MLKSPIMTSADVDIARTLREHLTNKGRATGAREGDVIVWPDEGSYQRRQQPVHRGPRKDLTGVQAMRFRDGITEHPSRGTAPREGTHISCGSTDDLWRWDSILKLTQIEP